MTPQKSRPGAGTAYTTQQRHDSPIDRVLHSLERVKKTGLDKWIALCPAHDDKRPSLSIREVDDGKVLLRCWTGCGAAEIVGALGLSLADLFPGDRRSLSEHGIGPMRRPFNARDALEGVAHEVTVARLVLEAVNNGRPLDDADRERLALAWNRITDAAEAMGGGR